MFPCFIKFMDQEKFAKQLLLECGALIYCPKNHHLVRTIDKKYVDNTVELAKQIFIICNKFKNVEELEHFIRDVADKHRTGCTFCRDLPEVTARCEPEKET